MPFAAKIVEILQASENGSADDALVVGLSRAEPERQAGIVEALIARGTKTGLAGIVANFHRLDKPLKRTVLENSSLLFTALRSCVKTRDQQARENTIELTGLIGSYRLAYLLSLALRDSTGSIRQRAAQVLRELADRYFRQEKVTLEVLCDETVDDPKHASVQAFSLARLAEERSYLISAIDEAVNNYDIHHRPEVAETVVWFAEHLSESLWKAVASRLGGCGRAVTELAQSSADPRTVPFMYEALHRQDLRPTVARAIAAQTDTAYMREFVRWSFLLADPRIRRGAVAVRSLAWLSSGGQPILDLEPSLYPRAVDLIMATGMADERKVAICRDLLVSDQREAQVAGLWGLVGLQNAMSTQLIRTVIRWDDPELAGVALREMMHRTPRDLPSILADRVTSESDAIRELAAEEMGGYGFDQYWQSFEMLDEEERQRLGRVVQRTVKNLPAEIRAKLASSKVDDRLRGAQIIATLELTEELEESIYRTAYDPDAYVRSSVMSLLGSLPGPTSERILLNGINDPDERVQANSIESLERLRAFNHFRHIRHRLESNDNRVRANAVKALLVAQTREAVGILIDMLHHEQTPQRISALWVIESLRLMTLSARVLKMAKYDPDPTVRRRAVEAVGILNSALRDKPDADQLIVKSLEEAES